MVKAVELKIKLVVIEEPEYILLLLKGDLEKDINALLNTRFVMRGGK